MTGCPFGFRVLGLTTGKRRLVDWRRAFDGHCQCDERAELDRESYLSAFTFGDDFRRHLETTGSTASYKGVCGADWLWVDIDRADDLKAATTDARRLVTAVVERYQLDSGDVLIFFSGSKGYHVGLPTGLWAPEPSPTFNRVARRFAEYVAELADVTIDTGVYDAVRCFRGPNSRHPKTGLHKRRLTFDELLQLSPSAIAQLAAQPEPFDVELPTRRVNQLGDDWREAVRQVETEADAKRQRLADGPSAELNRLTFDFIRDGASEGDRHRLLYSAAANLAEFGCPSALAHALLTESARDSGLPPTDIHRGIDNGLQAVGVKGGGDG